MDQIEDRLRSFLDRNNYRLRRAPEGKGQVWQLSETFGLKNFYAETLKECLGKAEKAIAGEKEGNNEL